MPDTDKRIKEVWEIIVDERSDPKRRRVKRQSIFFKRVSRTEDQASA